MAPELALFVFSRVLRPAVVHAWSTGSARGLGAARTGLERLSAYAGNDDAPPMWDGRRGTRVGRSSG